MRDNSVRSLPLKIFQPVALRLPAEPAQQLLRVEDDSGSIESRDIESLSAQLRLRYPDGQFERYLPAERDEESERRYAEGMTALAEIFAQAAVDELLRECAHTRPKS